MWAAKIIKKYCLKRTDFLPQYLGVLKWLLSQFLKATNAVCIKKGHETLKI